MIMTNTIVNEDISNILGSKLPWHLLEGKTVLISGAAGFLPAYMVKALLELSEKADENKVNIIGIVRNIDKARSVFSEYTGRDNLKLVNQDICDPVHIDGKIDYILHAASQASPKYYGSDPVGTLNANVLGTNNLLKLALQKEVENFLFFSSGDVYGQVEEDQVPTKETDFGAVDPMDLRNCYTESKRMGENMCISWHHQYGVPVKIVRPFHTYGPGMSLNDGRVFADFVSDIIHNTNIVLNSDGSATRGFCYLADAVKGFFTVLLKGRNGEAYNVGYDKSELNLIPPINRGILSISIVIPTVSLPLVK